MRVTQLWRFPVKSMQGEQVDAAVLGPQGLPGDRRFALFDTGTGFGLTARRVPQLLLASARLTDDNQVEIRLPDGGLAVDNDALSQWLGRPVALRSNDQVAARRYEDPADFEDETGAWDPFDGSDGAFQDSADAVVSLVSTGTVGGWALRRFRANIVLDSAGEDELVGSRVALGDSELDVGMRIARCVMVTRAQSDALEQDLDVLRTIHREREGCLAVGATVARAGTVRVGDEITALG